MTGHSGSFVYYRHWLAKQPSYAASREFDVGSTRSTGVTGISQDIEDDAEDENSPPGVKRTVIQFLPSFGERASFSPFRSIRSVADLLIILLF